MTRVFTNINRFSARLRAVFLSLVVIVLLMNSPMSAWAEESSSLDLTPEEHAWLAIHPEINFAFPLTYPPALMRDKQGRLSGFLKDIIDILNKNLGTDFGIVAVPGGTALKELHKARKVAGQMAVIRGNGAARGLLETNTLYASYAVVYSAGSPPVKIARLEDLKGKTVVALTDALYAEKTLAPILESIDLIRMETLQEALTLLGEGKVDFMLGTSTHAYLIAKMRFHNIATALIIKDPPMVTVMGVRDDWPELTGILNKGIGSISNNEWHFIFSKWSYLNSHNSSAVKLTPEEQAWLAQNSTVRVRITNWPPYMIVEENASPQGIVIDYLRLVEERTGLTLTHEVTAQPFAEFLESIKQRQGPDMTALISPTPGREEYLSFTESYVSAPYVIFIRKQDTLILDINDLAGKTLAVLRGSLLQEQLVRDYPQISLALFDSDEEALQAVATGQSDAYIGNLIVASHIIQSKGFSDLQVAAASPFEDVTLSMGIRNDWPELAGIINKVLVSITEEEKVAIRQKYLAIKYEQGIDKAEVLKWVIISGGAFLSIVILIILWNRQLRRKVKARTAELSDSESRFRATFEQAAVGIAHVSPSGHYLRLNQKYCDIVGYSHEEMVSMSFQEITHPEDLDNDLDQVQRLLNGNADSFTVEKRYIRKDSSIVWVNVTVRIILGNDTEPKWFVVVVEDISERKQAGQSLLDHQQRLKAQATQLTLIEEQERRRIATDLHDNVGQTLALSRLQLAAASNSVDDDALKAQFNELSQTLLSAVQDTRHLIFELSSPTLYELGLGAAISEWVEQKLTPNHNLAVELVDKLESSCLSQDQSTVLFRSVRELLTNIIKYARADKASVLLEQEGKAIRVTVKDNGIGFNPEQVQQNVSSEGGLGLFSIEERMTDLGGTLIIDSRAHHGTTIVMTIPCSVSTKETT